MENKSVLSVPATALISSGFKLVSIPATATLATALTTLINANIYGAPVSTDSEAQGSPSWIGFLELTDVVAYIVSLFQHSANSSQDNASISSTQIAAHKEFTADQLSAIDTKIRTITVKELFTIRPPHSTAWSLTETVPLQTVIDALSTRSRVVLLSGDGAITGLVSRSALVNYLAKSMEALSADSATGAILQKTLGEIPGIADNRKMITAYWNNPDERALDAFAKIAETGISHLALVAGEGGHFDLVGNVSVKDIKTILDLGVASLLEPVGPYINKIRQENLKAVHPAIHAALGDTLDKCIVKLAVTKIHRMYVTSGNEGAARNLVGVVTLGDVIRLFRSK